MSNTRLTALSNLGVKSPAPLFPSRTGPDIITAVVSDSLQLSWRLPHHFLTMNVFSILSHCMQTNSGASQSASCIIPGDAIESTHIQSILQSVDADTRRDLGALLSIEGTSTLVKYWTYMRLFWRFGTKGSSDRVVLDIIALIEHMHLPNPFYNRKNSAKWTAVRRGLHWIGLLLNHPAVMEELVARQQIHFNQLLQLKQEYSTIEHLQYLLDTVRKQSTTFTVTYQKLLDMLEKRSIITIATLTLTDGCDADELSVRSIGDSNCETGIKQIDSADASTASSDEASETETEEESTSAVSDEEYSSVESEDVENEAVSHCAQKRQQPNKSAVKRAIIKSNNSPHKKLKSTSTTSAMAMAVSVARIAPSRVPLPVVTPSIPLSKPQILYEALMKMRSIPLLQYYYQLLKEYPQQVQIAAPLYYDDINIYQQMLQHRTQDYCQSRILLYNHDYLLHSSNQLQNLPAYQPSDPSIPNIYQPLNTNCHISTKIRTVVPDFIGEESNSQRAQKIYSEYYPSIVGDPSMIWEQKPGEIVSLPAEILLKEGIHLLLVIHREYELVSTPSCSPTRYHAPCAQVVHTLPAPRVLSAAGNYCSLKHLVDTFQHKTSHPWQQQSALQKLLQLDLEVHQVHSSSMSKPTGDSVKQLYAAMDSNSSDSTLYGRARCPDLEWPSQCLYLLDRQLSSGSNCRITPQLIADCAQLVPTVDSVQKSLAILTGNIISAFLKQPNDACQALYGCGMMLNATVSRFPLYQGSKYPVFRWSNQVHIRPILFVRTAVSIQIQDQAKLISSRFNDNERKYTYNIQRPKPLQSSRRRATVGPRDSVINAMKQWQDSTYVGQKHLSRAFQSDELQPASAVCTQDIHPHDAEELEQWKYCLSGILLPSLVAAEALQFCHVQKPGVHTPSMSYFVSDRKLLEDDPSTSQSLWVTSEIQNPPQRLGLYDFIFPQIAESSLLSNNLRSDTSLAERGTQLYSTSDQRKLSRLLDLTPPDQLRPSFVAKRDQAGTLDNGALYVAQSQLRGAGLGLFAKRQFDIGTVVTSSGGILEHEDAVRQRPVAQRLHTRRIPDSNSVWNGRFASLCFSADAPMNMPVEPLIDASQWKVFEKELGEQAIERVLGTPKSLLQQVRSDGLGYMINHHQDPESRNVQLVTEHVDKAQLLPVHLYFVATKIIHCNEEIYGFYGNLESRCQFQSTVS